jgi:hypothetical protein
VRAHSPRKRAGCRSIPPVTADAPNVVWAIDFEFDSTRDGKAIKIASMIDEHPKVAASSGRAFDHRRTPCRRARSGVRRRRRAAEGAADGQRTAINFSSAATVLRRQGRYVLHSARIAVEQRIYRIVPQPATQGVPQPQPLEQSARSPGGHRRLQTQTEPPPPAFRPGLPNTEYTAACRHTHTPVTSAILNPEELQPDSKTTPKPIPLTLASSQVSAFCVESCCGGAYSIDAECVD